MHCLKIVWSCRIVRPSGNQRSVKYDTEIIPSNMVRFLNRTLRSVIVRVELNWHSSLLMVTCPASGAFFAAWLLAFPNSLVCSRKKKNNYATANARSHAGVGGRYWPRGFGALNPSPLSSLLNIYFRLSRFQSSLLYTCLYCDEERPNLSDMRRSTFMICAAQLRSVTEIVVRSPFLSVNILLVFSVTPFKIDQNKNQNHAIV